jgi:hypothetical protein
LHLRRLKVQPQVRVLLRVAQQVARQALPLVPQQVPVVLQQQLELLWLV